MSFKTYLNFCRLYLSSKLRLHSLLPKQIHPLRSSIRLTEKCNSKCITCDYWKKKWEDKISTQKAIRIIIDLKRLGVERIRFTGGEPFLRKDFFDILSAIKNCDFKKVTVATNGLLLQKYADEINASPITDLGVSIDGLKKTNDMLRGIDGHFDLALEGIDKIKKRITIMTTLNQKNAYELQDLFNIFDGRGLLWDINLLDNHLFFLKGADIEKIWPNENAVDYMINTIKKNFQKPVLKRINDLQLEYVEKYLKRQFIQEPPCYLGYTDIDIDSAGNLWTGCYVLPPIGSIFESNLYELLQSSDYLKRLNHMRKRQCPGCSCGYELNLSIDQLPKRAFEYFAKRRKK